MSKELLGKLFGRYVRDASTEKQVQGTPSINSGQAGLGPYRRTRAEHGAGQVWAESEGEGKESRFFVRLSKQ